MDLDLYEAGKQLLLDGRKALRTAGQLQHLPQLSQNASKIHQRRPETQGFQGQQCPRQAVKLDMAKAKGKECM